MEIKQIRMSLEPTFRVKLSNQLQYTELKFAVRSTSKENPLYFEPVDISNKMREINIEPEVEINNFGRWLFGVKGFAGHWKNTPTDENGWVEIFLPNVKEAKELIKNSLEILKTQGLIKEIKTVYRVDNDESG